MPKANQQIWGIREKLYTLIHRDKECLGNNCNWDEIIKVIDEALSTQESKLKAQWRKEIEAKIQKCTVGCLAFESDRICDCGVKQDNELLLDLLKNL